MVLNIDSHELLCSVCCGHFSCYIMSCHNWGYFARPLPMTSFFVVACRSQGFQIILYNGAIMKSLLFNITREIHWD